MNRISAVLLALAATFAPAFSHICIVTPRQRGNFSVAIPGDPSCFRRTVDACTSLPASANPPTWPLHTPQTLTVQQNLNHWSPENAGAVTVSVAPADGSGPAITVFEADDYPAFDMVETLNRTAVVVPDATWPTGHVLVSVRYRSNNAQEAAPGNAHADFFNCADVVVGTAAEGSRPPRAAAPASAAAARASASSSGSLEIDGAPASVVSRKKGAVRGVSCTAPSSFLADSKIVYNSANAPRFNRVTVAWDLKNNRTAIARQEVGSNGIPVAALWTITDYTRELEWVFDPFVQTCDLYGPDAPYPWGYGASYTMDTVSNTPNGDGTETVAFANPSNGLGWTATRRQDNTCLPASFRSVDLVQTFFNVQVQDFSPDSSYFQLPSYCKKPEITHHSCRVIPDF